APAASVGSSDRAVFATWIDGRRGDAANPATDVFFAAVADAGAPTAPLIRGGPVVFRLSSTDAFTPAAALRFRCAFDGLPLRPCIARVVRRLAPGRHVFRVQAVDPAGNRSAV